jgi:hypothetical protein
MDSVEEQVSQLLRGGVTISRIVLEMVDAEFTFEKIRDVFVRLGHYVAGGDNEHKGEMLIADHPGPLEVGATATRISWGGGGTDDIPHRNHPEEILVEALRKQGASIGQIVAKLVEIGFTASELRDLLGRLGYKIYGGGYGEPSGWMLVGNPADEPSEGTLARVHWGGDHEEEESFAVEWNS